jgi:hypothetical protein
MVKRREFAAAGIAGRVSRHHVDQLATRSAPLQWILPTQETLIKDVQCRKTINEKMGLTEIENMVGIRNGKITARFVLGQGITPPNSS